MKWLYSVIFLVACNLDYIISVAYSNTQNNCKWLCENNQPSENCRCHQINKRLGKRDTVAETLKKLKKNKKFMVPSSSIKHPHNLLKPEGANTYFDFEQNKHRPLYELKSKVAKTPTYKELQERFRELQARMLGKPQLKARANFPENDKPNLIEQFKSKQEELIEEVKEKLKKSQGMMKKHGGAESLNRLQNRINNIDNNNNNRIKLGDNNKRTSIMLKSVHNNNLSSSTTTTSSLLSTSTELKPIIVLMSSTSSTSSPLMELSTDNMKNEDKMFPNAAIERIKEKQKKVVTKIMDKIQSGKVEKQE